MKNLQIYIQIIDVFFIMLLLIAPLALLLFIFGFSHLLLNPSKIILFIDYVFIFTLFVKGIWHLKKSAHFFLNQDFYQAKNIQHLNSSGKSFVFSGLLFALYYIIEWIFNIIALGHFNLGLNTEYIPPIFMIIIGIFLMIQSQVIKQAKTYKDENDLTI